MSASIVTAPFRLAFPEVFEAKASTEGGRPKYSITMIFPTNGQKLIPSLPGEGIMDLRKLLFEAVKEKWGEDKAKWPPSLRALDFKNYVSATGKDGWPIRDGNTVEWDGFSEGLFARASSQFQPGLVDNKLQPILDRSRVFGGLICRAQINAYAFDTNGNRGVTFGLNNLQVLKDDGVIFGGREAADKVFGSFADGGSTEAWDDEVPF